MKEKPREFSVRFQNSNYIIEYIKNGNFELHKNYQMIEKQAYTKAIEALKQIANEPLHEASLWSSLIAKDVLKDLGEL